MPHVEFVPLSGFRVREEELLGLGMTLPGLGARGRAIGELPALGVLTLAGMLPPAWTAGYRAAERVDDELVDGIVARRPDVVAISCLTASALEAYTLADRLRAHRVPTVIGGLHATALPDEAGRHCDAVVVGDGEAVWPRLIADRDWSHYTLFDVVHHPTALSVARLEAGFRRVVGAVFGPGPSAARARRRRRVWADHPAFRGRPPAAPGLPECPA